jgi:tetratricopeptide (TPR) repeat protein
MRASFLARLAFASILALLAPVSPTEAATPQDWKDCNEGYPETKKIAGCNRVLADRKITAMERAKALVSRGYGNYFKKDYSKAFSDVTEAIRTEPTETSHLAARAWMHKDRSEFDKSLADYTEAIRIKPSGGMQHARSEVYLKLGDEEKAKSDLREAVRLYTIEIERGEAKAPQYLYLGRSNAHRELGQLKEALADMSMFIERDTSDAKGYYYEQRGDLLVALGQPEAAIEDYTRAIKQSAYSSLYAKRAAAYRAKVDFKKAIADYDWIESDSSRFDYDADASSRRGLAKAGLGDLHAAVRDFSKSIEIYPFDETAYYNRAQAYRLLGNIPAAMQDYAKALEINPNYAIAYNSRARAYQQVGDTGKAFEDFERALVADEHLALARYNRGSILLAQGKLDQAITDLSRAIADDPASEDAYIVRADARAAKGQLPEAVNDLTSALKLAPVNARLYALRSSYRLKLGQLEPSLDDVNRALLLDAASWEAYALRSQIKTALGRGTESAADLSLSQAVKANAEADAAAKALALKEQQEKIAYRLSHGTINLKGTYPVHMNDTRRFTVDTMLTLNGDTVKYSNIYLGEATMPSKGGATITFAGNCAGKPADAVGKRDFKAYKEGTYLRIETSSDVAFATGSCAGSRRIYAELYEIELDDGKCRFTYEMSTKLTQRGPDVRDELRLLMQPCSFD